MKKLVPLALALMLAACGNWGHCEKMKKDCCGSCGHSMREPLSERPLGSSRDWRHSYIQTNAAHFREGAGWGHCDVCPGKEAKKSVKKPAAAPLASTQEAKPATKPEAKPAAKEEKKGWFF